MGKSTETQENISILQFFMQAGIIMYVRMSINFDVV